MSAFDTSYFIIQYLDVEPPTINCPQNMLVTSGDGITLDVPTVEDEIDPTPTVSCIPVLERYPEGITAIECTATDMALNEATCTYDITVGKNDQ